MENEWKSSEEIRIFTKWVGLFDIARALSSLVGPIGRSKVGCVLASPGTQYPHAWGVNGAGFGAKNLPAASAGAAESTGDAHAEINALMKLGADVNQKRALVMAVTRVPCRRCISSIINSGLIGVVVACADHADENRTEKEVRECYRLLMDAGIACYDVREIEERLLSTNSERSSKHFMSEIYTPLQERYLSWISSNQ